MNRPSARFGKHRIPTLAFLALAVSALFSALPAQEQPALGSLRGRVLDEQTLQPIADVSVRIRDTQLVAITAADGRFLIVNIPTGPKVVELVHLAYGEHLRVVVVATEGETQLGVRLTARPLALDSVVVRAPTELDQRRQSTGFAMNEIQRPSIDRASQMGLTLGQLLGQEMAGVRVRGGAFGPNTCVEFRGAVNLDGRCNEVNVFLDGVPVTVPGALFATMPIHEIERMEVMSPGQAGALYGSVGGAGVLLIETRRGTRPDSNTRRENELLFGFDWSEEERAYPWFRVAGSSLLGNALGLGVSLVAADQCFEVRARGILSVQTARCNAITTMLAGFVTLALPAAAGSYAARWAGGTGRSHGRVLPGLIVGTISAAGGYLLFVRGQGTDSAIATNTGALILTVGTPVLLTFSDRLLRILR
jgi:hypothetical protein